MPGITAVVQGQVISPNFQIQTNRASPFPDLYMPFHHTTDLFSSRGERTEAPKPQRPALLFFGVFCSAELSDTISLRSVQDSLYWPVLRFLGGNNPRSLNTFRAFAFSRSPCAAEKDREGEKEPCLLWASSQETKQDKGGGGRQEEEGERLRGDLEQERSAS